MEAFGSYLSQVTEVSSTRKGAVKVHRVVCTVDCGWVINPDTGPPADGGRQSSTA